MTILKYPFLPSEFNSIDKVVKALNQTQILNCTVDTRKETPILVVTYKGKISNDDILQLGVRIGELIYNTKRVSQSLTPEIGLQDFTDKLLF